MNIQVRLHKLRLMVAVAVLILFVSCNSTAVFDEFKALENNSWPLNKPVEFDFQIVDTISKNNLYINLRNNADYSYSNLYIITHLKFPNGKKIVDTLQYEMADQNGQFLGKGLSEIKESKLFYKEAKVFQQSGTYQLSIKQSMRKNGAVEGIQELEGITDVGLRIEKIQ